VEQVKLAKSEKDTKRLWLQEVGGNARIGSAGNDMTDRANGTGGEVMPRSFWDDDEGLAEVRRGSKAA